MARKARRLRMNSQYLLVTLLKKSLRHPVVHDSVWESGRKFWCPFCQKEVNRHWTSDNETVQNGGFLEHLSSKEHHRNSYKFWRQNHLNEERRGKILLREELIDKFEAKSEKAMVTYREEKQNSLKKAADELKLEEDSRWRMAWHHEQMVGLTLALYCGF
ncbi:hypothetical protein CAPTEDRAFT_221968 [Capitella teleta]|uniref:Coiled-coil domain-containing protein 84 n=1 Tax=Capitella teleta TaxID=283909 RepID=R7UBE8_CAPTE|nr:hypothetical protein CAPTEDRAFT_221968 [Capitella teleta]|eukprot:ELU00587.1 hypothetical protein CAPTEDRAFT_221968 [Capitella teleta]